ncbi:DUF4129 domain-containing protein [Dictyobacter arantiisoli]|uniref:Protein-glutamine gamma-glutamyltransferase-like C-terminal domain-containing protein n=1 Tax=Dictyobacter arantiisoli TaxID=2014874 RepID=A0A5A5T5Q6_9CHLR|nr:DUF4129 domain-containing protein [Dictyobacter arantiisoli]GCF06506.1 hypothetical protein KDI_00700 [Dictyobacter arantiisoli]
MRLFKPALTDRTTLPAHIASRWIEILAIPLTSALMETQALFLLISLFTTQIMGTVDAIGTNSILCILLFFHWWAMWREARNQRRGIQIDPTRRFPFTSVDVVAIVLALAVFGVTHISDEGYLVTVLVGIVLIGWAWKRGIDRTRAGYDEDHIILWFKIGFGILLFIMFFSLLGKADHTDNAFDASDQLLRNLPIFFLSGFIALSYTRIAAIRQERERQQLPLKMAGTNRWLTTLTITWILLILASIGTEFLPAALLITLLTPLWLVSGFLIQILFTVLGWLTYLIALGLALLIALLARLFPGGSISQGPAKLSRPPASTPPPVDNLSVLIFHILLVIAAIALLIGLAMYVQKHRRRSKGDMQEEEEIREGLNAAQIRKERRQQRQQSQPTTGALIEADPDSARARYRAFLRTMAEKDEHLARQPDETPAEYQQRFLIETGYKLPAATEEDVPTDATILTSLTQAYTRERYGGRQTQPEQRQYLHQWVPHLLQRLSAYLAVTPKTITHRPYQASRWGEDE